MDGTTIFVIVICVFSVIYFPIETIRFYKEKREKKEASFGYKSCEISSCSFLLSQVMVISEDLICTSPSVCTQRGAEV